MTLSAGTLQREVLHPLLDAQAHNDRQALGYFNPTPEHDSLVELFNHPAMPPELAAVGLHLCSQGWASNDLERDSERRATGFTDSEVRRLNDAERNGDSDVLSAKRLAFVLRPALRVLADPSAASAAEFVAAVRTVDDLIRRVPRAQLLATEHELGTGPHAVLVAHVASYERGARADDPSPAVDPKGSFGDAHES